MSSRGPGWSERFQLVVVANAFGSIVWTVLIVLPFPPFSYLPAIIVGGGAGIWFVTAYLLYLLVGVACLGWLAGSFRSVEAAGSRLSAPFMWLALVSLEIGVVGSCVLLGLGGALGGYASTINAEPTQAIEGLLQPFVLPVSSLVLLAAEGAATALLANVRARGASK